MAKNRKTQNARIVAFLQSGKALTAETARTRFGVERLSARIFELRRGETELAISTTTKKVNGKTVAAYVLDY